MALVVLHSTPLLVLNAYVFPPSSLPRSIPLSARRALAICAFALSMPAPPLTSCRPSSNKAIAPRGTGSELKRRVFRNVYSSRKDQERMETGWMQARPVISCGNESVQSLISSSHGLHRSPARPLPTAVARARARRNRTPFSTGRIQPATRDAVRHLALQPLSSVCKRARRALSTRLAFDATSSPSRSSLPTQLLPALFSTKPISSLLAVPHLFLRIQSALLPARTISNRFKLPHKPAALARLGLQHELPEPGIDTASLMPRGQYDRSSPSRASRTQTHARFFGALLAINVNGTTGLFFTPAQCGQWQIVQGVLLQLIVTTVDFIPITRNAHTVSLGALFLAELVSLCYILAVVTPRLTYNDACYVTSSPPIFQYFWVISLAFETVLFVLTIGTFIDAVRQGWGKGPAMQQFVADGTWAYTLIFIVMLINKMLYKLVRSTLTDVVLSFAGSRLILNPRRASTIHSSPGDITRSQLDIELSRLSRFSALPARAPRHRAHGIAVTIERTTTTDNLEAHISRARARECV
ncbi:uncharacterized protein BXZ73DRAFT_111866 [Epithele typhae]|uniref:uncharacterized protein n=1 Tax=Epithele typhae TaxID=378194 RepID=UPI002008C85A|nr:uncharacterized protein BXZ73DRAFT_111866 [Epithele typhae]KAH9895316.1 hypothetical protein BXZ73DRAFT_111866 [Epithele typhae]